MDRIITAPALAVWNGDRKFPDMRPTGDGTKTFPTRTAYHEHLREIGMTEIGVRAKIHRPHGNKVLGTWR